MMVVIRQLLFLGHQQNMYLIKNPECFLLVYQACRGLAVFSDKGKFRNIYQIKTLMQTNVMPE